MRKRAPRLGSWEEPLDFDLHINDLGEPQVPFANSVKLKAATDPALKCSSFYKFPLLPVELQHHVLSFCDRQTLFQLRQVSLTRRGALKNFWCNAGDWYCIDGNWLFRGAYQGETCCDLDFFLNVEHVNIQLDLVDCEEWADVRSQEKFLSRFWPLLRRICPHVAHVLVDIPSGVRDAWDSSMNILCDLFSKCPVDLKVSLSLFQDDMNNGPHAGRSLLQLSSSSTDGVNADHPKVHEWVEIRKDWTPRMITPPPKKFEGPVGDFERWRYKISCFWMQDNASTLLLVDSIERHHFRDNYKPFSCPVPTCNAYFQKPTQFLQHANATDHDRYAEPPEAMAAFFKRHSQKLNQEIRYDPFNLGPIEYNSIELDESDVLLNEGVYDEDQAVIYAMEEEVRQYANAIQRRTLLKQREQAAERAFLQQLEQDPLYATSKPPIESRLFLDYLDAVEEIKQTWMVFQS